MSIYKVYGLSEMMIQHCDIDKNTFSQMERREYSDFIDEKFAGESFRAFILSESYSDDGLELEFKIGDENEIKCHLEYSEKNQLPAVEENKIRLVCWEMLENTNASIDVPDNINELTLKIEGNTFGCMDDWGNKAFETYSFIAGEEEKNLFIESESFGNVEEKLFYFLDSEGNCEQMEGKVTAKEFYEIKEILSN